MNFIRIGNQIVNLKDVKAFKLTQVRDSEINVVVIFHDDSMNIQIPTLYDKIDAPTLTMPTVAGAIQDAIAACCDADCEAMHDYLEDNLEDDEE